LVLVHKKPRLMWQNRRSLEFIEQNGGGPQMRVKAALT
jgi:hypothetical protein